MQPQYTPTAAQPQKTPPRPWTPEEDATLRELYLSCQRTDIAALLGRTIGSVRKRCSVLGLNTKHPPLEAWQKDTIRQWYEAHADAARGELGIDELAARVGMDKTNVAREARRMGLTNGARHVSEQAKAARSKAQSEWLAQHDHPRGMLGKKHTAEFKAEQSKRVAARVYTPEQESARIEKMMATRIARYGTGNPGWTANGNAYSRTKSGKRADLGGKFFRSAWEANYARYLNWLIGIGVVAAWEFEPQTFTFQGELRGVISYTPDFLVTFPDGRKEWHEVKGWMDAKSKARLKKMAKYYPGETIVLIDGPVYRGIERAVSRTIAEWEGSR